MSASSFLRRVDRRRAKQLCKVEAKDLRQFRDSDSYRGQTRLVVPFLMHQLIWRVDRLMVTTSSGVFVVLPSD
jgi:hypothetical protein